MNTPTNPMAIKFADHASAVIDPHHRKVENTLCFRACAHRTHPGRKLPTVALHRCPAVAIGRIQRTELHAQQSRLQGVEPTITSALVMTVTINRRPPMIRLLADARGQLTILRDHRTTITQGTEILPRVEAESRRHSRATGASPAPSSSVGLRRIFYQSQSVLASQFEEGVDVNHLAEQVDPDHRSR